MCSAIVFFVRAAAAPALGRIGDRRVRRARPHASDDRFEAAQAAARALAELEPMGEAAAPSKPRRTTCARRPRSPGSEQQIRDAINAYGVVAVAYFAVLNLTYIVFTGLAWRSIMRHLRAPLPRGHEALASPLTPPVSLLLPAYNEEAGIVESVHSLLALRYPEHEVVVINDGSKDTTCA